MVCAAKKAAPFLSLAFFVLSCFSKGHDKEQKPIAHAALKKDFNILRKTLEEVHPGLYWYSDKARMDHCFDSAGVLINRDMTGREFFKLLLPVIAGIRCVHTNLRLPDKKENEAPPLHRLLPFEFFCRNNRLYIAKAMKGAGHEGAEIVSINGRKTGEVFETLLNSLPADGYNETYKYHLLSEGAFREGYALFFEQPERFTIEALNGSSPDTFSFTANAVSPQQTGSEAKILPPPFLLTYHQATAILAVNTFQLQAPAFTDAVESIFKSIQEKKPNCLIIDLRQNGGGANDNVSTLFSYVASSPFLHLKRAEMNAGPVSFPQFIHEARTLRKPQTGITDDGKYLVNDRYAGTSLKYPAKTSLYKGKVLLLTSGQTTSAASEFAALARAFKRAQIIGEETGGCYYGATGGDYLNLTLPASGLKVRIPTIRIFTAVAEDYPNQPKGRGTLPDYPVVPTINDILQKKDVQLEKALALAKE